MLRRKKSSGDLKANIDFFKKCGRRKNFSVLIMYIASIVALSIVISAVARTAIEHIIFLVGLLAILGVVIYLVEARWERKIAEFALERFKYLSKFLLEEYSKKNKDINDIVNSYVRDLRDLAVTEAKALQAYFEVNKTSNIVNKDSSSDSG